jgi:hypothetical protein
MAFNYIYLYKLLRMLRYLSFAKTAPSYRSRICSRFLLLPLNEDVSFYD